MNELTETIKQNKLVLIIAVIAFTVMVAVWLNSPMYHNELRYQKNQVIDFLKSNSWQIPEIEKNLYMENYGITESEVNVPLENYLEKGN